MLCAAALRSPPAQSRARLAASENASGPAGPTARAAPSTRTQLGCGRDRGIAFRSQRAKTLLQWQPAAAERPERGRFLAGSGENAPAREASLGIRKVPVRAAWRIQRKSTELDECWLRIS